MTLSVHDFWCGISKGAGHCLERFFFAVERLGDTEISQDEVRVGVPGYVEEVFGFEICATKNVSQ